MQPFDPPGQGDSGLQIDYDARRVRLLDCITVHALLKSRRFTQWNDDERAHHPVQDPDSDEPKLISRYDAGYATLTDAIVDVGIDVLDPGPESVKAELAQRTPEEQTAQLRAWLDDDDRVSALARAVLAGAYPARADELFGWKHTGLDINAYWAKHLESLHMEILLDTADFGANELLRILYLLADVPEHLRGGAARWRDPDRLGCDLNFPTDAGERLRTTFTRFKYWFDDPFRCSEFTGYPKDLREQATPELAKINHHEKMDPGADMTYWSENHRLLFGTAEYLAGQYWPDDQFVSARQHRKEGPDGPPRQGDVTGAVHRDRGRRRVLRWLDERLRLGFSEWNAPGYYVEDVVPLVNLVDFALDELVQEKAAMVLDLLVLDLAIHQAGGAFAGSAGRAYFENKSCSWEQSIGDSVEVLFGNRGHFVERSNAAIFLATSPAYRAPDALIAIGSDQPSRFTSRARISINFDESEQHGVGFSSPDDMEFWWSRGAYATKQTILGSRKVAEDHGLVDTPPFKDVLPMIKAVADAIDAAEDVGAGILGSIVGAGLGFLAGGPVGAVAGGIGGAVVGASIPDFNEVDAADLASVITEGSAITRVNLYAHHSGGAALASVLNFRPGQLNFQCQPSVAALENGAMVWTTYPSAGTHIGLHLGSTTWAMLGLLVAGPIGLIVGAAAIPDLDVDETVFNDHNGPNWWTGNAVQPRVVQHKGAAIIAYQAKEIQQLLFGSRTHAWFPRNQFDATYGPVAARSNLDTARWFFGRAGASYVGLLSARETNWEDGGAWQDTEIRAEGSSNIFIKQIGSAAEFGTFEAFIAKVSHARVGVSGLDSDGELRCSYDIPFRARLDLRYDGASQYGGERLAEDEFPRLQSPFARIAWLQDRYVIQHRGKSVVHDIVAGKRTVGGRLDALTHETPLTYYAQNIGLLAWPLYKGTDRDAALNHLIGFLDRTRPDVVGLSEMWSSTERKQVCEALAEVYPFSISGPYDPLLETPFGDVEVEDGGLLLLSRYPIATSSATVYRQCSGDDCLANKGALHARIQPRGHPCTVDVFLTHTQAAHPTIGGTTTGARTAVEGQIRHLAAFVRACRDIVTPAVLFGDFNVDWFAHRDLYDYLVSTLGSPFDVAPISALGGRSRPSATSENDDDGVSSFQPDHSARSVDDAARFGGTAERLDYIFAFPGLLYSQHLADSRLVVEQWEPGRDMSDHYGVEAVIDMSIQLIPQDRPIASVTVRLSGFHCLQTSGIGDDEVRFTLTLTTDTGAGRSVSSPDIEDVEEGDSRTFALPPIVLSDPGEELHLAVSGQEIDTLSADDTLGRTSRTFSRDELLAMVERGPVRMGMPTLRGDGSEYVVDVEVVVDAPIGEVSKRPVR
jgi:hypothetical protein